MSKDKTTTLLTTEKPTLLMRQPVIVFTQSSFSAQCSQQAQLQVVSLGHA